jgi:hypothetical protein
MNGGRLRGLDEEVDEGERKRGSFEGGVSVEGEYAFTKGVEAFCKAAVKEGRFRGPYLLNVKEQLTMRVRRELEEKGKVRVVTVGASEMSRIRKEWVKSGGGKLELGEEIRVKGSLDRKEGVRIEEELESVVISPDKVVIAGPGNSLMAHERGGVREGRVRRVVTVKVDKDGKVEGLTSCYHLTEPDRLTMCERVIVAKVVGGWVRKCRDLWPLVDIYYVGILPRHIWKCCDERRHMSDVDPQVIDTGRRALEDDILDEIRRTGERVEKVKWSEVYGMEVEPSLEEIRRRDIVSGDGVHLTTKVSGLVAGLLYRRLLESELEVVGRKRRRSSNY